MAKRSAGRREVMRRLIEEQESSGQSVSRFARERGMSRWTLYKWKRELREEPERTPGRDAFVELKLTQPVRGDAPPITVEVGDLRVRVPRDFEEDHLRRLLAVLSSC